MVPTSTDVAIKLGDDIPPAAEAIAVCVHKNTKPGDPALAGWPPEVREAAESLLRAGVVTGKSNEVTAQVVNTEQAGGKGRRLLIVGLGAREKFSGHCLLEAGATLAKVARKQKLKSLAVLVPDVPDTLPGLPDAAPAGAGAEVAVESLAAGFLLGSFEYREYKGSANAGKDDQQKDRSTTRFTIVIPESRRFADALDRGRAIGDGQNFARTIASRPGNDINPLTLASVAQDLAKEVGLRAQVLDEKQMAKLGMGGILAVGAGSIATPPRLIVLEYQGAGATSKRDQKSSSGRSPIRNPKSALRNLPPLLVVGKAITFDTGGISIKPAEKMGKMIFDKCGGMAVLGMMYAVAKLKLPINVVGVLSSAENHVSSRAYRPGDILRMYNGVTVEVTNTDAEGRLVLGDALAWGIETYNPAAVVDLATLTGGVVVALGKTMAGAMSNDDALVDEFSTASAAAGEKIWRLPLGDDQRDYIKSDPADIVNSGGREGHPLQGGAFLSHFVKYDGKDKIPWVHLDIAGVADTEKEQPTYVKGATGWGVRTLVRWAMARAGLVASHPSAAPTGRDRKVPPPKGG